MRMKRRDLLTIRSEIEQVIANDKLKTLEQVQCAVSMVIDDSLAAAPANALGKKFWELWKPFQGSQVKALELALGHLAADQNVKYLVVARIFSAPDDPFDADHLWDDVLAICAITFDDDDKGPPSQPRPWWMREWGLKRRRTLGPR